MYQPTPEREGPHQVSIRTPREGRDMRTLTVNVEVTNSRFNPHAPRGARPAYSHCAEFFDVSIRTPREGRDNPHAPRGARPV